MLGVWLIIFEIYGNSIGKSIIEKNCNKIVEEIVNLSKKKQCKLIYPEDVVVSKSLNGSPQKKELNEILSDEMILDIGPKTIEKIINIINSKLYCGTNKDILKIQILLMEAFK